jgi:GxxExxY protein
MRRTVDDPSCKQECHAIIGGCPAVPHPRLTLRDRGRELRRKDVPDFLRFRKIVVELKALLKLPDEHRAPLRNYRNATGHPRGVLVNFGHCPGLEREHNKSLASVDVSGGRTS